MLLEKEGLLQDESNIPIIYHRPRNEKKNKKIPQTPIDVLHLKYSTTLPSRDTNDFHRLNFKKYWWLHKNSMFLDEMKRRGKRKA